jgi:hypothetical protein
MEFKSQPSDLSNRCGKFTVRRAHENFERYSYGNLYIVIFHICGGRITIGEALQNTVG